MGVFRELVEEKCPQNIGSALHCIYTYPSGQLAQDNLTIEATPRYSAVPL